MRSIRLLLAFAATALLAVAAQAQISGDLRVVEEWSPTKSVAPTERGAPHLSTSPSALHPATLAASWNDGPVYNTYDYECFAFGGPFYDAITGEYCGYAGDQSAGSPKAGIVYYVHVFMQNVAACAGVSAYIEGILPANTSLAVSSQNPVFCFSNLGQIQPPPYDQCPQSLQTGTHGGYKLTPTGQPTWSLGTSAWIEIRVPVITSTVTNDYFKAYVQAIDGNANPTDQPKAAVYVSGTSGPPTITYASPSTTMITDTTATSTGYLQNHYTAGNLYSDIGTSVSYSYTTPPAVVPNTLDNAQTTTSWSGLVPGTTYHWRLRFVPNTGSPVIGLDQTFTTTGITPPAAVVREDFNNDARSDLILQNSSSGDIAEWRLNDTGTAIAVGAVIGGAGSSWKVAATGYFNADKFADLILQNSTTGDVVEWQMNGTVIIAGALIASPGTAWKVIATGDFNGDGKSDIVLQNSTTSDIAVWLMNGFTITGGSVIGSPGLYKVVTTGDFNADGRSDLLLQNSSTGDVAIWRLNTAGTALAAGSLLGSSGIVWKAVASGDVNGDLQSDIILQNSNSGDIAVWQLNVAGTAIAAGANLGGSGTVWRVVGTGDYDADGNSDLMLQNTSTGDVARWKLNNTGTAISSGAVLGTSGTIWVAILN